LKLALEIVKQDVSIRMPSSGQKIFISASRTYFWNAPHTTTETDNYGKKGK
jgi:hypothetical protein